MPDSTTQAAPVVVAPCLGDLEHLERTVCKHYRPELWEALKTALAVVCSLSLKERAHPLALIFEGPSGRGKSTVINMCQPDRPDTAKFLFRVDAFTPRAFVSHAANVSREKLKDEVDLLPRIKNRTLLTKELAPIFRAREAEVRQNFSVLTAVLDGKGLMSSSGVHGTRGYEGSYLFNWIGATTPIPEATDEIMAQLGNRLLRYEIVGEEESEEELIQFAASYQPSTAESECQRAVNDFILGHFQRHAVETIDPQEIQISTDAVTRLVALARLIAHGRVEVSTIPMGWSEEPDCVAGPPEGSQRIILLLRTLLQGLAVVSKRRDVAAEDLDTVRHVAYSSIPRPRRQILRAVLIAGGQLTSDDAAREIGISPPTARRWMKQLAATGIVELREGSGNRPHQVSLTEEWSWLLPGGNTFAESETEVCAYTAAES